MNARTNRQFELQKAIDREVRASRDATVVHTTDELNDPTTQGDRDRMAWPCSHCGRPLDEHEAHGECVEGGFWSYDPARRIG